MKKKLLTLGFVLGLSVMTSITSFAGTWQQDHIGWWWQEDNGSYPVNAWKEIGGKYYYFDGTGYMLANTTTPDGYKVGADGAWIVEQTSQLKLNSIAAQILNASTYEEAIKGLQNVERRKWGWDGFVNYEIQAGNIPFRLDWDFGKEDGSEFFSSDTPHSFKRIKGTVAQIFDGLDKDAYTVPEFESMLKSMGAEIIRTSNEVAVETVYGMNDAKDSYYNYYECELLFTIGDYEFWIRDNTINLNDTLLDVDKASVSISKEKD